MNRRKFIKKLKYLARLKGETLIEDRKKGKGSHYMVFVGDRRSTVPKKIGPVLEKKILKDLGLL